MPQDGDGGYEQIPTIQTPHQQEQEQEQETMGVHTAKEPFGIKWRSKLVQLPRYVPSKILHFTSPEGPHPFILSLPSREGRLIPNYVFVPNDLTSEEAASLPVVVDFHGGSFVLGSPLEQAPFCAMVARELRCVVISVDYRLGPINKYPAANEDAEDIVKCIISPESEGYGILRQAIEAEVRRGYKKTDGFSEFPTRIRLDRQRIAVSGFSSGGNLALNLALTIDGCECRDGCERASPFPDDHSSPIPLLLFYPSFDARQLPSERNRPEGLPAAKGFWSEVTDKLVPSYLPRDRAHEPRASPGLAPTCGLHDQARMFLVLPELDDLSEQSETWVQKLQDDDRGHDLKVQRFEGMTHGWTQMPESWLSDPEKVSRLEVFDSSIRFVRDIWDGHDAQTAGQYLSAVGHLVKGTLDTVGVSPSRTSDEISVASSRSKESLSLPRTPGKYPKNRSLKVSPRASTASLVPPASPIT